MAVSVPLHSAGSNLRSKWATRITGCPERSGHSINPRQTPRRLGGVDCLALPLSQAFQTIQRHQGAQHHMNDVIERQVPEHPFGQALQEHAAKTKEEAHTDAPERI